METKKTVVGSDRRKRVEREKQRNTSAEAIYLTAEILPHDDNIPFQTMPIWHVKLVHG